MLASSGIANALVMLLNYDSALALIIFVCFHEVDGSRGNAVS